MCNYLCEKYKLDESILIYLLIEEDMCTVILSLDLYLAILH